jgi:hypothetical protein
MSSFDIGDNYTRLVLVRLGINGIVEDSLKK